MPNLLHYVDSVLLSRKAGVHLFNWPTWMPLGIAVFYTKVHPTCSPGRRKEHYMPLCKVVVWSSLCPDWSNWHWWSRPWMEWGWNLACVSILHPDRDVGDKLLFWYRKMLLSRILLKSLCDYYWNVRESWITWVLLEVGDIWISMCCSWDCTTLLMLVSLSALFSSLYLLGQA